MRRYLGRLMREGEVKLANLYRLILISLRLDCNKSRFGSFININGVFNGRGFPSLKKWAKVNTFLSKAKKTLFLFFLKENEYMKFQELTTPEQLSLDSQSPWTRQKGCHQWQVFPKRETSSFHALLPRYKSKIIYQSSFVNTMSKIKRPTFCKFMSNGDSFPAASVSFSVSFLISPSTPSSTALPVGEGAKVDCLAAIFSSSETTAMQDRGRAVVLMPYPQLLGSYSSAYPFSIGS